MLQIIVLGAAAGGGLPQWNCACDNCKAARLDKGPRGTQVSLAVSANQRDWLLINASPDLRQQIDATPKLHPAPGKLRHSPIAGVVLTNAEVDAVAGLLSMREGSGFSIYAHPRVLDVLQSNSIFRVLKNVPQIPISPDVAFEPLSKPPAGLRVTPFDVPGKPAWYLEDAASTRKGDTLGLRIDDIGSGKSIVVITACAQITSDLKAQIADCDILFFDGTLWRDDELIAAGLHHKTGEQMGHVAMSGTNGAIAALADVNAGRKVFVHVNNSNPVWHASPERQAAERDGWEIGYDGMEFAL